MDNEYTECDLKRKYYELIDDGDNDYDVVKLKKSKVIVMSTRNKRKFNECNVDNSSTFKKLQQKIKKNIPRMNKVECYVDSPYNPINLMFV